MKKLYFLFIFSIFLFVSCPNHFLDISFSIQFEEAASISIDNKPFKEYDAGDRIKLDEDSNFVLQKNEKIFYKFDALSDLERIDSPDVRQLLNTGWIRSVKSIGKYEIHHWVLKVTKDLILQDNDVSSLFTCGHMVLYMLADHKSLSNAIDEINKLERGYRGKGRIFIYVDAPQNSIFKGSLLLDIKNDFSGEIVSPVLKAYPSSFDPYERLSEVLKDINENAFYNLGSSRHTPLKQKDQSVPITFILWGISSGWIPVTSKLGSTLLSFGENQDNLNQTEMDINKIFHILSSSGGDQYPFFILNGGCMGSLEVINEYFSCINFSGQLNYILASPFDTLPIQFPFDSPKFLEMLVFEKNSFSLSDQTEATRLVESSVDTIFDYAKELIPEKELCLMLANRKGNRVLTDEFKNLLKKQSTLIDFSCLRDNILPLVDVVSGNALFYSDFLSLCKQMNSGSPDVFIEKVFYDNFYIKKTATLNGRKSNLYCGISCYVPYHLDEISNTELIEINDYYSELSWVKNTEFLNYIKPIKN